MESGRHTSAVTFIFTDIEGSTRLWETDPAWMTDALSRHDTLCRITVKAHKGRLVKMTGDGLHAVFNDAAAAVASVLELQRGMAAIVSDCGIAIKMRCGLHAGVSEQRDGDYFGSAVNRAARIMAAAHGGQVLLSQSVVDLARGRFPAGTDVLHLGRVRLRDLTEPEDLWQLLHTDLTPTFPALRSLDSTPNNLPQQLTSFIGRENEIADVKQLLRHTRLLTLTGSGGCGKTRLAIQVVADLIETYPDGVWLVELAALSDPSLVPQALMAELVLREEKGKSLTKTLTDYLKLRHVLIVLDNAEHLLGACAQLADSVLRQCSRAVILVTSREALGIDGERTYRVPSLAMPDPKQDVTPIHLSRYESVRLFTERAQLQLPQFVVTEDNASALASVCHRLDGIPLALELAAARVRSLSVHELSRRLDQRFQLLTGGSRTALPRQQTLRSLIDWSYDLLNNTEKALLIRLTVFAGGWTLELAEHNCSGQGVDKRNVLDLLTSLVDKSLVTAEERDSEIRFRMLETVRQYARDRLAESGDGGHWRHEHLSYFLDIAEEAERQSGSAAQQSWLDRLESEHENLRSALAWSATADGDAEKGLLLAGVLSSFWNVRGYFGEGRRWLSERLAAQPRGRAEAVRGKALQGAGRLAWQQGDYAGARSFLEESLECFRTVGDRRGIAVTQSLLGSVAENQGDRRGARALHECSLATYRELGDHRGIAYVLNQMGNTAYDQGDLTAARALYEESLAIYRESGDTRGVALTLGNVGRVASGQEDYLAARSLYGESLAIVRELGDRRIIANTLNNLGQATAAQGELPAARLLCEESLKVFRDLGVRRGIAWSLISLGDVISAQDDPASRALYEESLAISQELGDRQAIAYSLEGLAIVALTFASPSSACRIWGGSERLREEIGMPLNQSERRRYDPRIAAARVAVGDDATFEKLWHEGRTMTLEQAIEYALAASKTLKTVESRRGNLV